MTVEFDLERQDNSITGGYLTPTECPLTDAVRQELMSGTMAPETRR